MELANWKNLIQKFGGLEYVSIFIFDNSRYCRMDPAIPAEDQVEIDDANDAWIFRHPEQCLTINGKKIPEIHVEANDSLQCIIFCEDLKDKPKIRMDI